MGRMSLQEFQDKYDRLIIQNGKNMELLEIFFTVNRHKLPMFPSDRLFDSKWKAPWLTESYDIVVPVENIIGQGWLFENSNENGRPVPERLASLFLANDPAEIIGPTTTKVNEKLYYTSDGNHRIYAAYLRGNPVNLKIHKEVVSE